ncbi:MAG TPA: metal ABC transporter substrate-binding protein [Kiritimatiellia bacterium]|mgnify:CR=1 FL=1|nr:metal ABC transporter substrate-binding protein [Kiritimatiellia bacterium]
MRIMYQYSVLALLALALGASAESSVRPRVVATTTLLADVARAVAGPDAEVTSLIPLQTDPHAFDPTPRDMARLQQADLVVANGLGLETFLDKILAAGGARDGRVVVATQGRAPRGCAAEHDHHGHDHGEHDPHVWFDPTWVQLWADNIAAALAARDPANAEAYRARAQAYREALDALDRDIQAELAAVPRERRILVTDHDEFGYLADRYELTVVGALLPNVTTVAEASARALADLQRRMRETGARVIVVGHSANPAMAEQVARDTGARVIRLHTHSLGPEGSPTATYIDFMRHNIRLLAGALRADAP